MESPDHVWLKHFLREILTTTFYNENGEKEKKEKNMETAFDAECSTANGRTSLPWRDLANIVLKHCFVNSAMMPGELVDNYSKYFLETLS